jgi:ketoreductase
MRYRRLGDSGLQISEIIYGNMRHPAGAVDEAELAHHARAALDAGITTFDTADIYGMHACERSLGKALDGVPRDTVELISKVSMPVSLSPNGQGLSRKHVMESIDGSLRRLGTDHLDVYVAHRYDYTTPLEETMRAFADLTRVGKILYMGCSEWRPEELRRAVPLAREYGVQLIANMMRYSMLWRLPEQETIGACEELGLGVVPYFGLEQGVLTGKYRPGEPYPDGTRAHDVKGGRAALMRQMLNEDVLSRVAGLGPVAGELGITTGQLATAWLLSRPAVCGVTVGATRAEHLEQNAAASGVVLEPRVLERIDEILGPVVMRTEADLPRAEGA